MKNFIIVLLAIITIGYGCKPTSMDKKEKVDYKISVGETFDLKLGSSPSTGYVWSWANKESVTVVDTSARNFVMDEPVMDGSSGNDVWTFIGKKAGTETIILHHAPSWQSGNVDNVKKVIVKVK